MGSTGHTAEHLMLLTHSDQKAEQQCFGRSKVQLPPWKFTLIQEPISLNILRRGRGCLSSSASSKLPTVRIHRQCPFWWAFFCFEIQTHVHESCLFTSNFSSYLFIYIFITVGSQKYSFAVVWFVLFPEKEKIYAVHCRIGILQPRADC